MLLFPNLNFLYHFPGIIWFFAGFSAIPRSQTQMEIFGFWIMAEKERFRPVFMQAKLNHCWKLWSPKQESCTEFTSNSRHRSEYWRQSSTRFESGRSTRGIWPREDKILVILCWSSMKNFSAVSCVPFPFECYHDLNLFFIHFAENQSKCGICRSELKKATVLWEAKRKRGTDREKEESHGVHPIPNWWELLCDAWTIEMFSFSIQQLHSWGPPFSAYVLMWHIITLDWSHAYYLHYEKIKANNCLWMEWTYKFCQFKYYGYLRGDFPLSSTRYPFGHPKGWVMYGLSNGPSN